METKEMTEGNKGFIKQFNKCPGCGSGERFYGRILKGLQDRGLVAKEIKCFAFQLQEGIPLPEGKLATLPFGAEIPGFKAIWDICFDCGMNYFVHLEERIVKKSIELAQPNRAERRRMEFGPKNLRQN